MTSNAPQVPQSDGRPIYAYKWDDEYYANLKEQMRIQMSPALRGTEPYRFSAMFCVYASETFRRCHEGGPWTWETIFNEIGYEAPAHSLIHTWVERGLRYFKRDLLKSNTGRREFLLTLACEGGLPLRLLHKESAHLSHYFRELLTAYHRERHTPGCDATLVARQIAARYLPPTLRRDVVFKLSGDLIQSIVDLQERVAEASDPIASLDREQPKWRDNLPLPVEDDTVDILLRNLIGQAVNLTQTEQQRWRWRCFLIRQGEGWGIEQRLELPGRVTGASLQDWSGWNDPPARLRVLIQTAEGVDVIALLTRLHGMGEEAIYRCEALRDVRLQDKTAVAGARLLLSRGSDDIELQAVGGQELGPLPWVFAERGTQWEWCGEGSVRRRETSLRVLTPNESEWTANAGDCEFLGTAPALQRSLYQMTEAATWQHPELGMCQIRCSSLDASDEHFVLWGRRLSLPDVHNLPFLGMPSLYAVGQEGTRRRIDTSMLEWRPLNAPESAWRRDAEACAGKVWLRYREASGALRFRRQADVMPVTTRLVMVRIGARTEEAGVLRLSGLPAVRVTIPPVSGCHFRTRTVGDDIEIDCFAEEDLSVTQFCANLQWPDTRALSLILPFPRQGAAFIRAGQILPKGYRVALGRLAALHAVVQTPRGSERFRLEGLVQTQAAAGRRQAFHETLRAVGNEPIQYALHRLQERVASMLALSGDRDAVVVLEIVDWEGQVLAQLEVAQFDVALEPDRAFNRVMLPLSSLERLGDTWHERMTVKMLPLWEPMRTLIDLERDGVAVTWQVPEGLEPGPWWVLGYDGNWARFRPLLWVVPGEKSIAESGDLIQAIHEPPREVRQAKLQALVSDMAADAHHPDWPRLVGYLRLSRTYPASTMDILQYLVHTPEAMVLALLRSSDEDFDLVWSLADQLPFAWHLVPVSVWLLAAERYFGALRVGLADIGLDGTLIGKQYSEFRQRVTARQPFFRQICDWIGERIFPDQPLVNSELALARRQPSILIDGIQREEQLLQSRHVSGMWYPDGPDVMQRIRQPNFFEQFRYERFSYPFRPIRCAPFVAAQVSLDAEKIPEALLFELRQLRDFDTEWFDNVFALALCLGLAQRPVTTEGMYS